MANKRFKAAELPPSDHSWEFNWTISDFSSKSGTISNTAFDRFPVNCPVKWKLCVKLKRDDDYTLRNGTMDVGVIRLDINRWSGKVVFSFEVQNSQGEIYVRECFEITSSISIYGYYLKSLTLPENYGSFGRSPKGLNNMPFWLYDNKIIVKGNIFVEQCCLKKDYNVVLSPYVLGDNAKQLQMDFKTSLRQNPQFADVILKIGRKVFHAHKFILCARSPVFSRMFENNMIEKESNTVKITDIDQKVFEEFLSFLYTGILEDKSKETAMSLFVVADKYEVKTLLNTCRDVLTSHIKPDTACDILKLADTHSDTLLRDTAVEFISRKFSDVESTAEWKKLLESDPRLASLVLKRVSSQVSIRQDLLLR